MNKENQPLIKKDFFSLVGLTLAVMLTSVALISPYRLIAANISVMLGATNRTAILTNAVHVNSISVINVGTNPATIFAFFDAPGSTNLHSANAVAIAQTNGGFTNFSYSVVQVTNTYTNIFGFITNDIFTGMARTTNAQAPAYTPFGMVGLTAVASGAPPATLTFNALSFNSFGLIVTNLMVPAGVIGISVDYNPLK